jgi:serine/threonine protein kinase
MVTSLQEEIGESIRVVEVLRQSGAESLVEARDLERHVPVVLRVLDLEVVDSLNALPGFEREAARAVGFRHLNIATAQPLQRRESLVFYALNVGYAKTLDSLIATGAPLSFEKSIDILQDIAAALDYELSQGLIHGRLAPDLIFVDDDHVMVAGFGGTQGAESDAGRDATIYQAPEQGAWRQEVDSRVDVYALGVIAYELLSGKRYSASIPAAAALAEPFRISRDVPVAPGVSLQVNEAIMHATAKRPSQRFATAGEFIFALDAAQSEPVKDVPAQEPAERIASPRSLTLPRFPSRPSLPSLPPRFGIALGIGCLCVVGALTVFSLRKKIAVPHLAPAISGALSRFTAPLQSVDQWIARTRLDTVEARPDTDAPASPAPRATPSGVIVENGVLVFPGERRSATSSGSRGSASRRTAARDLVTKPTAH